MATVRPGDGTTIGYERSGAGPSRHPLAGAAGHRGGGPPRPPAADVVSMAMAGVPPQLIEGMRGGPGWPAMEAIAPTLAYDDTILDGGRLPVELAATVTAPALVLDGGASPQLLRDAAKSLAAAL